MQLEGLLRAPDPLGCLRHRPGTSALKSARINEGPLYDIRQGTVIHMEELPTCCGYTHDSRR